LTNCREFENQKIRERKKERENRSPEKKGELVASGKITEAVTGQAKSQSHRGGQKERKREKIRKPYQRGSGQTGGGAPRGGEEDRSTGEAVKAGRWRLGRWVTHGRHGSPVFFFFDENSECFLLIDFEFFFFFFFFFFLIWN
jgi:hypothetical protein